MNHYSQSFSDQYFTSPRSKDLSLFSSEGVHDDYNKTQELDVQSSYEIQ